MAIKTKIELMITGVKKHNTFCTSTKSDHINNRNPHAILKLAGEDSWVLIFSLEMVPVPC